MAMLTEPPTLPGFYWKYTNSGFLTIVEVRGSPITHFVFVGDNRPWVFNHQSGDVYIEMERPREVSQESWDAMMDRMRNPFGACRFVPQKINRIAGIGDGPGKS